MKIKKYFILICLCFILLSCNKTETLTRTDAPNETQQESVEIENNTSVEDDILIDEEISEEEFFEEDNIFIEDENISNSGAIVDAKKSIEDRNIANAIIENNDTETIKKEERKEERKDIGSICLFDECAPKDINFKLQKDGSRVAEEKINGEEMKIYTISKDKKYFEIQHHVVMNTTVTKVIDNGGYYIKIVDKKGCGGSNINQKVYDKNGKQVFDYLLPGLKSEIKIGDITFGATLTGSGGFGQPIDSFNAYKIFRAEDRSYVEYISQKDFELKLEDNIINKDKKLYKAYIAIYKNYPGVNVFYEAKNYDEMALRVVWLGTDTAYISKNINAKNEFLDLGLSNKIIGYYDLSSGFQITDKDGNRINKIDASKMPFFRLRKLNDAGNYLVYFHKDSYELVTMAEMCKPVVYYYSKENISNNLSFRLDSGDYFTKVIPEFNNKNSWDFSTTQDGKIKVENDIYDYLYYSVAKTGYQHNVDGWIVKGSDILTFFEDKLEKINFNQKEKDDFIDYWKGEYENEKYYFVSFKYTKDMDTMVGLQFSKNPEKYFRVLLDSYVIGYNFPKEKEKFLYKAGEPDKKDAYLIERFDRGNTFDEVFEWGGVLRKENSTVMK